MNRRSFSLKYIYSFFSKTIEIDFQNPVIADQDFVKENVPKPGVSCNNALINLT